MAFILHQTLYSPYNKLCAVDAYSTEHVMHQIFASIYYHVWKPTCLPLSSPSLAWIRTWITHSKRFLAYALNRSAAMLTEVFENHLVAYH